MAKPYVAERVERAALGDDVFVDADVQEFAVLADALAVHYVEFGHAKRGGDLVLDDAGAHAVAEDVCALLDGFQAAQVNAD